MPILVTGAAGFIGSHLVEALLARGDDVVGVDNFDPFYDRASKQANLDPLLGNRRFAFSSTDIRDAAGLESVFAGRGPFSSIVHLAAKAGVRPSIVDPSSYADVNVGGTTHLLAYATRQRVLPRFVFASSSSVYGNHAKVPFVETDNVDRPISPYAATKKAAELMCHSFHHLAGLDVFCLRLFTVYGPRQRPDLAIRRFATKILNNESVEMFGDGASSRDYTYIDDIVAGIVSAVDRTRGFEIVNLGSHTPVSLARMIEVVAHACNKAVEIRAIAAQPGDVERTFADVSKAERLLGYRPHTPFEVGVAREVQWLRDGTATS